MINLTEIHRFMKNTPFILIIGLVLLSFTISTDFLSDQKRYERVRTALKEKENKLIKKLNDKDFSLNNLNLIFIAYKDVDLLDVYANT